MKKVFVSGCYDIIHGGHIEFFNQAKKVGGEDCTLIVSFASDDVLMKHKGRKSSLPENHKRNLLNSISIIDEVVMGTNTEDYGLDFVDDFERIRPDYLVVTEDDRYGKQKKELCKRNGCQYVVLEKTLFYEKVSTSGIINWIKAPKEVPLRVDFCGGWLDVPKNAVDGGYIVNCAIQPKVSLNEWRYKIKSGLGGSAAYAILSGIDAVESELGMGVGWQDPAIIMETGFCIWKAGERPTLVVKRDPSFLDGKMALMWTGEEHDTPSNADIKRDYDKIRGLSELGKIILDCELNNDIIRGLSWITNRSYEYQLDEGMKPIEGHGSIGRKYCGGGFGGYAVYIFEDRSKRDLFCSEFPEKTISIEPFINI
jgi:cytidyltransferase-like protein